MEKVYPSWKPLASRAAAVFVPFGGKIPSTPLLQQKIAELTAEKSLYQVQYEHAHQTLEKLQINHDALNQVAQEARTQYHSLSQENTRLTQLHQNQSHDFELKKQSVIELQIKLTAHEDKIRLLEKEFSKANDKVQILRDDFSFVSQEKANLEGQLKQLQTSLARM